MRSFEASGRTVEEAISAGLAQQGLSIGDVSVEILEEGSKGLFGLFGSRDAKVRLTLNQDDDHSDAMDLLKDSLAEQPRKQKAEQKRPQAEQPAPENKQRSGRKPAAERPARPAKAEIEESKAPEASKPARERKPREKKPQPAPQMDEAELNLVREVRQLSPVENPAADSPAGLTRQFLLELTRLMGLEIAVSLATDPEGHVFATLEGDPQGILIGRRGETLDALQYLTSLRVNRGQENYIRVTLDSEGYRQKREDALIRLANRMANRARKTGRRVSMEPMNPYERRIFHSALQRSPGIATHSEGEEPNRHIVITPVKDGSEA